MEKIKYILFDAANTLIHKPILWTKLSDVFLEFGYKVNAEELKLKHKLLSEFIKFPDVTSEGFYNQFNKELLNSLGIIDTPELLEKVFSNCKYLPWKAFSDTIYLENEKRLSLGVISNFNTGLTKLLASELPNVIFKDIIISEAEGVAKPSLDFYKIALNRIGLKPNEILYIGDSLKLDVIPAKSLGFQVKLIDRENTYPSSIYSISSLKDIF